MRGFVVVTDSEAMPAFEAAFLESGDRGFTIDAELPPNGYFAKSPDGRLLVFSAMKDGHRADYCHSPAYVYCDGRGAFTRFAITR